MPKEKYYTFDKESILATLHNFMHFHTKKLREIMARDGHFDNVTEELLAKWREEFFDFELMGVEVEMESLINNLQGAVEQTTGKSFQEYVNEYIEKKTKEDEQ